MRFKRLILNVLEINKFGDTVACVRTDRHDLRIMHLFRAIRAKNKIIANASSNKF
jgi:hypothetical protein